MSTVSPAPLPRAPGTGSATVRRRPTPAWANRILLANLVGQVSIVVTGGIVRLSGSGLGCSTWPQCEPGRFLPALHEATSWHPAIEFGNRTLGGLLAVLALATAWVVWPQRERALSFRLLGLVPVVGVGVQAVVGGLTVIWQLHPAWVSGHFLISMLLVAASTALLVRNREGDGPPVPLVGRRVRNLGWALAPLAALVLALGVVVTGSGPHSGDSEVGYRFALDPVVVSRMHAAAAGLFLGVVVALLLVVHLRNTPTRVRRAVVVLGVVTLAQGVVGYVQYFTGLPEVLVGVHMLGASLLVVVLVRALLALRDRPPSP